eukprot:5060076-Prymnesium_polylepis.1
MQHRRVGVGRVDGRRQHGAQLGLAGERLEEGEDGDVHRDALGARAHLEQRARVQLLPQQRPHARRRAHVLAHVAAQRRRRDLCEQVAHLDVLLRLRLGGRRHVPDGAALGARVAIPRARLPATLAARLRLAPLAKVELADALRVNVGGAARMQLCVLGRPQRTHAREQLEAAQRVLAVRVRPRREARRVVALIVERDAAMALEERLREADDPLDGLERVPPLQRHDRVRHHRLRHDADEARPEHLDVHRVEGVRVGHKVELQLEVAVAVL